MKRWTSPGKGPFICRVCKREMPGMGRCIGVCPSCIRTRWDESRCLVEAAHVKSRKGFQLPLTPPSTPEGLQCNLCFHQCRMEADESGYCAARSGNAQSYRTDGRARALVSHYFDPIPTNCVADWVCPGGTGSGFPIYACEDGPEAGFYNLAVFFETCNLDCLFCQNWNFKAAHRERLPWVSVEELAREVTERTNCICFFGGDPSTQLPFALRVSERVQREHRGRVLRICWETNGTMHPAWLKRMVRSSLDTGGCIKVDLKAWNSNIHKALCGFGNEQVLENFSHLARWSALRPDPPFLVASTLLVPGYVDEEEIRQVASFISRFNPDIPYVLLAFAPQFRMEDFPTTSSAQAEACLEAARKAGLRHVRLGNEHLVD